MTVAEEIWKPIPINERYMASSEGRIKSPSGKILVPTFSKSKGGTSEYRKVHLGRKKYSQAVHKLVMLAFVGVLPEGFQIDHINNDGTDNRLCNLRYVTISDNQGHKRYLICQCGKDFSHHDPDYGMSCEETRCDGFRRKK